MVLDRDRFIAFAFASAHLLLETDNGGRITFAAGARCGLTERATEDLTGQTLFDLVPEEEHTYFRLLMTRLMERGKLDPTHVVFRAVTGQRFSALIGGCRLPSYVDRCFFGLSIATRSPERPAGHCLTDLAAFTESLAGRLTASNAVERNQALSMILIDGLAPWTLHDPTLREGLEAYLLSVSSDGDAAVRVDDERYAVLHPEDLTLEEIRGDIGRLLTNHGADVLKDALKVWQVPATPDAAGFNPRNAAPVTDIARALAHTLQAFTGAAPEDLDAAGPQLVHTLNTTIARVQQARTVIEARDFELVFQPIINLITRRPHIAEALLRINGEASPRPFLDFAGEVGLIVDLDRLVCRAALDALEDAQRQGQTTLDVSVNLSPISLNNPRFMEQLEAILLSYGPLARKLMVEVTESAALGHLDSLNRVLARLRRLGVRVCLDDIGQGQTPFLSLNALGVDFAKIDGRLLAGAMAGGRELALLRSVAEIATHSGIELIGEQVETDEQRRFLRANGIRYGQGFLFAAPGPTLPEGTPPAPLRKNMRRRGEEETWL